MGEGSEGKRPVKLGVYARVTRGAGPAVTAGRIDYPQRFTRLLYRNRGTMVSPDRLRVVLKFGGSSVSSLEGWSTILRIVQERIQGDERLLIVHSALAGVTDELARLPEEAIAGRHGPPLELLAERHESLAEALNVRALDNLERELAGLRAAAEGIALTREATPRTRARILAYGERPSTRLGAAFLNNQGAPIQWLESGALLTAVETPRQAGDSAWLSAECNSSLEPALRAQLDALPDVGLTQGFTARNKDGEAVVLGRGGSDTAAAHLAGKWGADRLEVWSDVPGLFTADPRIIPSARLLRRLGYREAQEIATTGSQVLHPRAVRALRDRAIPIHLKSTLDPDAPNTVISPLDLRVRSEVKAISWKGGVVLLSTETLGMWHEVGFLARAFGVFRELGLSIDLVSTSETNVTVSLDSRMTPMDELLLEKLELRLAEFCVVSIIRPCAAISLVGSQIRGMLHRLGPALQAFEKHRVHLVSQAVSDLNLTFVVDEDQAVGLVQRLHALLIPEGLESDTPTFGPRWSELNPR